MLERIIKDRREALKEIFRPEFLNRIDETVMFNQLDKKHISSMKDVKEDER